MDLCLQDIAVRFGSVQALDGVTVPLAPGKVTVLVGPNGAGKSTLLSVLLGLIRPDSGQVLLNGQAVASSRRATSRAVRARIGYLPEAVAFSDNLSGRQVLRFFAMAKGVPRREVEATLARMGLKEAAGRAVRGYSRGMRQRLGLGVAILGGPELLVLDEPTGGLDQQGLSLLWEVIAEWRNAGRVVVLSTHELALIERRADWMCVLVDGRLRAQGSPEALRKNAALPVSVRLDLAEPEAAGVLAGQLSEFGVVTRQGTRLVVAVPSERLLAVTQALQQAPVVGLRVEEPGLDEVYERLLQEGACASPVH